MHVSLSVSFMSCLDVLLVLLFLLDSTRASLYLFFFFFQAEDGIRDLIVTGVQTCALPILIALKLAAGLVTGAFAGRWRFAGLHDAMSIVRSALLAGGAGLLVLHWLQLVETSLRLVGADTSTYLVLSCGARLGSRWLHERARRAAAGREAGHRRTVIVGAGEGGAAGIKNIQASPRPG